MLMAFESVGGREDEFWAMTPRTYMRRMQAERNRLEREQKDRVELAWMVSTLSRSKKIPPLAKLLKSGVKAEPMTGEEVMLRLRSMTSAMPKKRWSEWLEAQ